MGTNFYAHWTPPASSNVRITLHICKSLTMFNGQVFPTWSSWKDFLTHGHRLETVAIEDEYGATVELDWFIEGVEKTTPESRRRQYDAEVEYGYTDERSWLDADSFSFHAGEFS